MIRRLPLILPAALATFTLAACGSDDKSGGTTSNAAAPAADNTAGSGAGGGSAQAQDALLKFTGCMRDHGIDLPDPQSGSDGQQVIGGPGASFDPSDPAFKRAEKACSKYLAAARPQTSGGQGQAQQEQMLKLVRCLRKHGVDVPDSAAQGALRIGPGGIDPNDPAFQRAAKACGAAGQVPTP